MSSLQGTSSQITDAVTKAHSAAGDTAITVIAKMLGEIAKSLDGARQGEATIDEISDALECAEVALHSIVARLATGRTD
jgi:hypothetical protein